MTQHQDEPVIITSYDPTWPEKFEVEKKLIKSTIGDWITDGPHHFGSTSVPNLDAKPIIDILIGVADLQEAKACISLLENISYCHAPYKGYMHWFCKPSRLHREFHVQIMEPDHSEYRAKLAFRDYLRSHPEVADEYRNLKIKLAEQFRNDREGFTDAKTEFITSILEKL